MAVLGLFTFMQAWNDFLWPLVVLTPENPTVQVALSGLAAGHYTDYTLVLAGTAIGTLPVHLRLLCLRSSDHQRHHGRCGKRMTTTPAPVSDDRAAADTGADSPADYADPAAAADEALADRVAAGLPADFVWGAATAAYQIEGAFDDDGRGAVDLGHLRRTPGRTCRGDAGRRRHRPLPPLPRRRRADGRRSGSAPTGSR